MAEIRKTLSQNIYGLSQNSLSTVIFATISMYLYYMAELENEVPKKIKDDIYNFISHEGIEDNTQIISWKALFKAFLHKYTLSYSDFIHCFHLNQFNLEFMLYSSIAHNCIMTDSFVNDWYLTNLFNSKKLYNYDYDKEFANFTQGQIYYLDQFVRECFSDYDFVPTESMKRIVAFYDDDKKPFYLFTMLEKNQHRFIKYFSKIKKDKLDNDAKQAAIINNKELTAKIIPKIKVKIEEEWGLDKNIDIGSQPLYSLGLRMEKIPEAINYYEFIADYFSKSIFNTLSDCLNCKNIYKQLKNIDKLDNSFINLINDNAIAITKDTVYISSLIKNAELKHKYKETIAKIQNITSSILPLNTFILKNGFAFNISIERFEALDLTLEQLNIEVDKYKRADGQYVYEGAFVSREEVTKYIKNKYVIFQLIFKYAIDTTPDSLIVYDDTANVY